jgi:hypothetical protein
VHFLIIPIQLEWLNEPDSVIDKKAEQSYELVHEKSLLGKRM